MKVYFHYADYPQRIDGSVLLTSGRVQIELRETPQLPFQDPGPGDVVFKEKPLQRSLRWGFSGDYDDDLKRFVRGKYWHRIQTLLFAEFLAERGFSESAAAYRASALAGLEDAR